MGIYSEHFLFYLRFFSLLYVRIEDFSPPIKINWFIFVNIIIIVITIIIPIMNIPITIILTKATITIILIIIITARIMTEITLIIRYKQGEVPNEGRWFPANDRTSTSLVATRPLAKDSRRTLSLVSYSIGSGNLHADTCEASCFRTWRA